MMKLAAHHGRGPVLAEVIARSQNISGNYIHVLVSSLRSAGLVRAVRGPSGGYELAKKPSSITALDVVAAMEGSTAPVDCVLDSSSCPRSSLCAARDLWCEVGTAMNEALSRFTLDRLLAMQRAKRSA
jgi:Rrf2 family cysteine metabolism transcriptional repressor